MTHSIFLQTNFEIISSLQRLFSFFDDYMTNHCHSKILESLPSSYVHISITFTSKLLTLGEQTIEYNWSMLLFFNNCIASTGIKIIITFSICKSLDTSTYRRWYYSRESPTFHMCGSKHASKLWISISSVHYFRPVRWITSCYTYLKSRGYCKSHHTYSLMVHHFWWKSCPTHKPLDIPINCLVLTLHIFGTSLTLFNYHETILTLTIFQNITICPTFSSQ